MARRIDGIALGLIFAGSVLLYAGIRGKSVPGALQAVIAGKAPSTAAAAAPITGDASLTSALGASSGSVPAGDTGAASASALANQAIGRILAASYGWATGQQWDDLVSLWNRESGWSSTAANPSGAWGIAQALGHGAAGAAAVVAVVHYSNGTTATNVSINEYPSQAANAGSATAQISWGLEYIKNEYGSPSAAWAHEQSAGWY